MVQIIDLLGETSPFIIYILLGIGAALENIVPPIPADMFVLLGAFLASRGQTSELAVFGVTWASNVLSALATYVIGYRYGSIFFKTRLGNSLMNPKQMETIKKFYQRWGTMAIFYTRFLPGLRAVVPIFAGVSRHKPLLVILPLLTASGIWYGTIVWVGAFAGNNLENILQIQTWTNLTLTVVAILALIPISIWWLKSRKTNSRELPEKKL